MTLQDLINRVQAYNPVADTGTITRAYEFSADVHRGQKRLSGEPYLTHPLEVAGIIAELKLDVPSIATGLLHDTVEDTLTSIQQVEQIFGPEIASLVDGVTKISQINFTTREEKQAENFRKMILAMARDIRVILVKLADRTHNMRTLGHLPTDKQLDVAQETIDIYAPLAHRLGIYWVKTELEDNALRYLHPEVYYQLKRWIAKKREERERYIKEVNGVLAKKLEAAGVEAQITGRPKHFYSIYQKMQQQNLMYDQIFDLVAFRVLVDSVRECYEALGIVHANWKPVPGRFKDYIALPKANLYQSLHTTVIGPYGERIEVQIRTHEMHRVAEQGIAAHWMYKGSAGIRPEDPQRFAWLKQLVEWQQNLQDPQEFLQSVKGDLFADEVYCFTPRGDILNFPEGATVIDFAYRIHSEVGNHCTGARANGKLVPLRYHLQSGDTVEIITTPQQTPSKDWLKIVKSPRASSKIRAWIKAQQRTRSVDLGREILERDLGRYKLEVSKLRKDGRLDKLLEELSLKDEEGLLAAVGYGRITPHQVLSKLVPPGELKEHPAPKPEGALKKLFRLVARQQAPGQRGRVDGVRVSGVEDVLVRFGRCCSPLPGESIAGFITLGRGVTVHSASCPRVMESDPARRVDVVWDGVATALRAVKVEVVSVDQPGMLASISKVISSSGINIARAEVRTDGQQRAVSSFHLMVTSAEVLNHVMRAIGKLRGVLRVSRVAA
jgi:GTP diphosphokinase / guanosine-3',5'-bis(diphosphate) 3'-diphosphatase